MGGGWWWEMSLFLKKGQSLSGGKNKKILIQIYLLPVEITFFSLLLFFYVLFSDLVIFSFDNHSWLIFFVCFFSSRGVNSNCLVL